AAAAPCPPPAPPPRPAGPTSRLPLMTVASGLDQPDDLLFHGGELLVGLLGSGTVAVLRLGLASSRLPFHLASLEGMAYVGSTLYVAGQAGDVVDAVTPSGLRAVVRLRPVAGQEGVDGIGSQAGLLVVPDSPRGTVLWVDPATGRVVRSLAGFVRPTGVWTAPGGSLLVADEFGDSAYEVGRDGSRRPLVSGLPVVDDIAQDAGGDVFAVTPAAGGGRLVRISGGVAADVADGLAAPQGLALDGAGNLFVTESGKGRVDLAVRTFELIPLRTDGAAGPACLGLVRGPRFTAPVRLAASAGLRILAQPGTGTVGRVLVTGCRPSPCTVTATSGALTETLWVGGGP
ncbi:MAG: hypothetical protein ACREPI_00715, partial [Candidatus Dormibacterales bacterium]